MTRDELIHRYAIIYQVDETLVRAWYDGLSPHVQRCVERTTTKNRLPTLGEDARAYEDAMNRLIDVVIQATQEKEQTL